MQSTQTEEQPLLIDEARLDSSAKLLKAITHPLRLSLIKFIDKEGETSVNKIYRSLDLEQSVTSQQLKILRETRLVNTRRQGKHILYSLNDKRLQKVLNVLEKHI